MNRHLTLLLKSYIFLSIFVLSVNSVSAQYPILSARDRATVQDEMLLHRFQTLLPDLMRKHKIDMWVIIAREYNEDPVVKTMLPATWLNARRRTILVFSDSGSAKGIERVAVARYNIGNLFSGAWNPETEPNQWKKLVEIIRQKNPDKIGLNFSAEYAHADGITHSEYDSLYSYLPNSLKSKIVSAEGLAVNWLEIRTQKELEIYETICGIGHGIIAEAFSEQVIHPGITSTEDVVWWLRERVSELKLDTWFHPTVDIQRADPGTGDSERSFASRPGEETILAGDLLHVDFGISYLGLNTDVQQLAYVMKPGETVAPPYLVKALETGNRLQDILTSKFALNKTGNEVLKETIEQAKKENIIPSIYSHPIGYHGHAAGPSIGMWDMQSGVPGSGEYPLLYNTAYAIELNARVRIREWNNKEIRVMLEEDAVFTPQGVRYLNGRQKQLLLIPRKPVPLQ